MSEGQQKTLASPATDTSRLNVIRGLLESKSDAVANPIEQAIQAAANAATAHGFVQALEQAAANMRARAAQLSGGPDEPDPPDEVHKLVAVEMLGAASAINAEAAKRKPQLEQLREAAQQAAALAYKSQPDMAKIREAVVVLMGAG